MKREIFSNPVFYDKGREAQVPLWFWNDKLDSNELNRQLTLMSQKGIVCCAPHARSGYVGTYLDQEWMKHFGEVVKYKKNHHETLWIYDEYNWPSGCAGGIVTQKEEFREKYLRIQRFDVPANTRFRLQPHPLLGDDLWQSLDTSRIGNVFVYDADSMEKLNARDFLAGTNGVPPFSIAECDFEILRNRDSVVFSISVETERYTQEGFLDPDYLNSKATRYFIESTHENYYHMFPDAFGDVITACFNDETRFCHAFPWTENLFWEFQSRYGYRLQDHLPDLILKGEESGRVRCDYFNLIADLYRQNYHYVLRQWCESHNIAYCPHLLGEETLASQVRYSGDLMRQVRAMSHPAVDHLGKGIGSLNIRFVSSAAEVYNRDGLICEVFAAAGWDLTYDEYIRMISWLYSQGVQTITNHGFFYSIRDERKDDWPPSEFFQWEGWEHMEEANAMCRRLQGIMGECRRRTDVLIYHPTETFWLHYIPDQNFTHGYYRGPFIEDERAAEIDKKEQLLLQGLQEANRDFTIFPSDAAELFRVQNKKLLNVLTAQTYSVFILPMCEVLSEAMACLLADFTDAGGRLAIVGTVPHLGMRKAEDETVKDKMRTILSSPNVNFFADVVPEEIEKWLEKVSPQEFQVLSGIGRCKKKLHNYPNWIIDPYIHTGEDMDGISWTLFSNETEDRYFIVNYTKEEQALEVAVTGDAAGNPPEVWDTKSGEIEAAKILCTEFIGEKRRFILRLSLPKGYGIFLIVHHSAK